MKLSLPMLALVLATGFSLAACTQSSNAQENGGGPNGLSPEVRAKMQQLRDTTKAAAYNDLSAADRAKVQGNIDQVSNGQQTDLKAAVKQIDASLTPDEAKAIMVERDKWVAQVRTMMPPRPDAGASPGAGRRGGGMNRLKDPGAFLLTLSVTPQKLRELRQAAQSKTTQ